MTYNVLKVTLNPITNKQTKGTHGNCDDFTTKSISIIGMNVC